MKKTIKLDRSIIPACDVSTLEELREIVRQTSSVEGIGGYKVGFEIVVPFGLKNVLRVVRELTDLPVIYDHQKAATDIDTFGPKFVNACRGVDAVIFFPQAGPETEKNWIKAAQERKMGVIVGGEMTHPGFLKSDNGFICDEAPKRMYEIAADLGVHEFVVPGNKPDRIKLYKSIIEARGVSPIFFATGFVMQGGDITESAKAAGSHWHAIVGRAIYESKDMTKVAKELTKKLG